MFPNSNTKNLYPFRDGMGREQGYSTRFIARDLLPQNKKEFADLWETTPYITTLYPGDVLYNPHRWWHEVYTVGQSTAFSVWLKPPLVPAPAPPERYLSMQEMKEQGMDAAEKVTR
jgi:hypothetical protein